LLPLPLKQPQLQNFEDIAARPSVSIFSQLPFGEGRRGSFQKTNIIIK
jgi:hypothetical protein